MLKLENKAVLKNERLRTLRAILMQPHILYKLSSVKSIQQNIFKKGVLLMTKKIFLIIFSNKNGRRKIRIQQKV